MSLFTCFDNLLSRGLDCIMLSRDNTKKLCGFIIFSHCGRSKKAVALLFPVIVVAQKKLLVLWQL